MLDSGPAHGIRAEVLDVRIEPWLDYSVNSLRNTESSARGKHSVGQLWYYVTYGLVIGAAIMAAAVLPRSIVNTVLVATALVMQLGDRLARRSWALPRLALLARRTLVYTILVGVAIFAALILAGTVVRRSDSLWLAWVMATVVFIGIGGTWFVDKQATADASSDPDAEKQLSE